MFTSILRLHATGPQAPEQILGRTSFIKLPDLVKMFYRYAKEVMLYNTN